MPSGLVVTNNHVIEGADEVKVALADKREFEAEIVLKDPPHRSRGAAHQGRYQGEIPDAGFLQFRRSRSAISCSPSAIPSASARP
jgi:hypothetical protein